MGGPIDMVRASRLYAWWRERRTRDAQERTLAEWERGGRTGTPPHLVKQQVLREFAIRYGLSVLVETGTYYGDMVAAMSEDFERIYSIELSDALYSRAKRRFRGADNVELIRGDSGEELKKVVSRLDVPALFWLDGHYSGGETARGVEETPIFRELEAVFETNGKRHVAVVDDARLFGSDPAYPTVDELVRFIGSIRSDLTVTVELDSIRIAPSECD